MTVRIVILAAGMGSRLGRSLPKPLTPLADGRSIIRAVEVDFAEDLERTNLFV